MTEPKTFLVCAASKGLGKASALALAKQGVALKLCARTEATLEETAQELRQAGAAKVDCYPTDLSAVNEVERLIAKVGEVDGLILNTGGPPPSTALETSLEAWHHGYEQVFQAPVQLVKALVPAMRGKGWGRVVAITSLAVLEPMPNMVVSNAMRAALTSYLKTLASEIAAEGVTVNCVAPGLIGTERLEQLATKQARVKQCSEEAIRAGWNASIPVGRVAQPEELGALVGFLCSEDARYLTGHTWPVDGGKLLALR